MKKAKKEKKIRVYFIPAFTAYQTGGEKFLFEVAKRTSHKYDIVIITEEISTYWRNKYSKLGIKLLKIPIIKNHYWSFFLPNLLIRIFYLNKYMDKKGIIISAFFPFNFLANFFSKKTIYFCFEPDPFLYDFNYINSLPAHVKIYSKIAKFLYSPLDKIGTKKSKLLVTFNESVGKHITKVYGRRPDFYTSLGVDTNNYSPAKKPLFEKKVFTIAHSTDYTMLKGTKDFLLSIAELKKLNKNFTALISESKRGVIEKKEYIKLANTLSILDKIKFVGTIPEDKLPAFYKSVDVFCYLGAHKSAGGSTCSMSVLEAQSCGIPVVRSYGFSEEIIDKKTGFLVNPNNYTRVAKLLLTIKKLKKDDIKKMKGLSRLSVINNFTWNTVVKNLTSAIDTLDTAKQG